MKRFVFRTYRKSLRYAVGAAVILTVTACSQNLVFDNEYDPEADNSPLGASITNVFANEYIDSLGSKMVDVGWDRMPDARAYEYEIVRLWWREETGAEAFAEVANGNRDLQVQDSIAQTENNPFFSLPTNDGVYAIRVRYEAEASHNGVTSFAWSPWSAPVEREIGVPIGYYATRDITAAEGWYADNLDFRGDRFYFIVGEPDSALAGQTVEIFVQDRYSDYPNGADLEIAVYEEENSFNGPQFTDAFMFNKVDSPISFQMPPSGTVYVMLESLIDGNTDFEIRVQY